MGRNYPMKPNSSGYIQIQFYDARTATEATEVGDKYPGLLGLKYYGSLPELKQPKIREELAMFKDRGSFQGWDYDEDTIDTPDVTFEVDMVDDQVTGTSSDVRYRLAEWFGKFKDTESYGSGDAKALISTNTGSNTKALRPDGTEVDMNLPTGLPTLGMRVLFDNGVTDKAVGFDFPCVEIRDSSLSASDMRGKFSFTVRVWSAYTDVQALLTQTEIE